MGNRQLGAAAAVTLAGMVVTTYAAFTHTATLLAPGSALIVGGAGWLGNLAARRQGPRAPETREP